MSNFLISVLEPPGPPAETGYVWFVTLGLRPMAVNNCVVYWSDAHFGDPNPT